MRTQELQEEGSAMRDSIRIVFAVYELLEAARLLAEMLLPF